MTNNDVLRTIRYMLDLSDERMVQITHLADPGFLIDKNDIKALLSKKDDDGHLVCSHSLLSRFLDGLVIYRRGRDETHPKRSPEKRVTNNLILKKLRVAFELRETDIHQIMTEVNFSLSKPEMSALFRQPAHKNFRLCGDQLLRYFLKGLTRRLRNKGSHDRHDPLKNGHTKSH